MWRLEEERRNEEDVGLSSCLWVSRIHFEERLDGETDNNENEGK